MISASSSALNGGGGMTSDEAAEVFRSMKVETTSKTPYSDATQVRRSPFSLHAFVRVQMMPVGPLFCFPCLICQRGAA